MTPTPIPPEVQQLLTQLEPIVAPPPVGWWPLAPGWWLLIFIGLGAVTALIFLAYQRYKRNAYRRQAIDLLAQLQPEANSVYAKNISALLKRTALSAYPSMRATINTSYGVNWLEFLNRVNPKANFNEALAGALSEAAYTQNAPKFDPHELKRQAHRWVKTHPRNYSPQKDKGPHNV